MKFQIGDIVYRYYTNEHGIVVNCGENNYFTIRWFKVDTISVHHYGEVTRVS